MSVDLRRFSYALEPLLQRRQWELDALNARLGKIQRGIESLEQLVIELRDAHREAGAEMAAIVLQRLDPERHARDLLWLRQLRARLEDGIRRLSELRAEHAETARARLRHQQKVDAIQAHRLDAVQDFARDESSRLAAEADKDWLMRQARVDADPAGRRANA